MLVDITDISTGKDVIVILDDLMNECLEDKSILSMFTKGPHHKNISVIFITQNIY